MSDDQEYQGQDDQCLEVEATWIVNSVSASAASEFAYDHTLALENGVLSPIEDYLDDIDWHTLAPADSNHAPGAFQVRVFRRDWYDGQTNEYSDCDVAVAKVERVGPFRDDALEDTGEAYQAFLTEVGGVQPRKKFKA